MNPRLLLPPANDEAPDDKTIVLVPNFDPKQVVLAVAGGILLAGTTYLQRLKAEQLGQLPTPTPVDSDVLTADEVAEMLRLDRKTVYDYAGRGVIPCQRLGKRMLFSRAALVAWLGRCSKGSSDGGSG